MITDTDRQKFGSHYSWDVIDNDTAIKKADKSIFESRGSGIPKETRWFWGANELGKKERVDITFYFKNKKYSSYIQLEARGRARIFWFADFVKELKKSCNYSVDVDDFPSLSFQRIEKNTYSVEIVDGEVIEIDSPNITNFVSKFGDNLEGARRVVSSVKIERSLKNRKACIKYYGTSCAVCGFNFEKIYGELGRGYIEIHHIVPLFKFLRAKEVDPIKDLTPLCSNCHRMIHRKKAHILLVDDLINIFNSNAVL